MGQLIDEMIEETPYMAQAREQADAAASSREAETVGEALAPVLGWTQSDVEFWVQVAQLVVLIMILRRLS